MTSQSRLPGDVSVAKEGSGERLAVAGDGTAGLLDEAYERFHSTGPEFDGWLSNHGPMATDALLRLGAGDVVHDWVNGYARRLEEVPTPRWVITEADWREPLGDPSRLGDWLSFFARELADQPWREVLERWWPRLLPGAVASATHGIIRTGHAVRALRMAVTPPRTTELAQALGYWAARWQPLAGPQPPRGTLSAAQALASMPPFAVTGGIRSRLAAIEQSSSWQPVLRALAEEDSENRIPHALSELTDAAVSMYLKWGHGNAVMLVHAATAPRAAALVMPSISRHLWTDTYTTAWTLSAAVTAAYRPAWHAGDQDGNGRPTATELTTEDVVGAAVQNRDEHVIKFTEVALESHRRGNLVALAAAGRAASLIAPNW